VQLEQWERSSIRFMLSSRLNQLDGRAFEDFFHDVMCLRYPTFVNVRAYGNLGDMGADGLMLYDRKLYACYGAEDDEPDGVKGKVMGDLAKALDKRAGAFGTFVFVHNDRHGVHPKASLALGEARDTHPQLSFEIFGHRQFHNELCRLERWQLEDLLGPFPAEPVVTGVVLSELVPLLDHLAAFRRPFDQLPEVPQPSVQKMAYNNFSADAKHRMHGALPYIPQVKAYYAGRRDPNERDEVAAGFKDYYNLISPTCTDSDEVLYQLERHILGNEAPSPGKALNALVVLMFFFGECEIFEIPPAGWVPETQIQVVT